MEKNEYIKNEPLIVVEHLSKKFNLASGAFANSKKSIYAVNDVSFCIQRGETYGIVGESGCGKTTTARLLIGMYKATSGKILYSSTADDKLSTIDKTNTSPKSLAQTVAVDKTHTPATKIAPDTTASASSPLTDITDLKGKKLKEFQERVKYVFQDPAKSLNPRLSIYDILTSGLKYSSLLKNSNDRLEKAEKIIEEVGLSVNDLQKRPSEFSGGQRQRICIARGLIMNPELLICDEVVSALDVSIQAQILNLLNDVRQKRNLSMVFITHDLKVACYFCDRIAVMYKGILLEEAPASDLYKTAVHPYTKLLFNGALGKASETDIRINEKNLLTPFEKVSEDHFVRVFD